MAVAILECAPLSHPFEERNITLTEPVKVGRSVARIRPAVGNAIFDCKVLSRNHALLWYEGGKFYLQDTKSSNGTFVNNNRLSKGTEESPPKEIFSGDVIKFGVDVVENTRNVTHNCIIAKVRLYHADGVEVIDNSRVLMPSSPGAARPVLPQELYQLAQYLQEALYREQVLEGKLAAMQKLVTIAQEASDNGWQALIDEDRLLSRLEMLENRLLIYSKNYNDDTLRKDLVVSREDLYNYEKTAKESVRKMLEEKLEALRKVAELEGSLGTAKEEAGHLQDVCEVARQELELMTLRYDELAKEALRLQQCLEDAERERQDEMHKLQAEKDDLESRTEEQRVEEDKLIAKVESLQANNDFMKEQLTNMKARLDSRKENDVQRTTTNTESRGSKLDGDDEDEEEGAEERGVEKGQREQASPGDLNARLKETQEKIDSLRSELAVSRNNVIACEHKVKTYEGELKEVKDKWQNSQMTCDELRAKLDSSDARSLTYQNELAEAREQHLLARDEVDKLRMRLAETLEAATIVPSTAMFVAAERADVPSSDSSGISLSSSSSDTDELLSSADIKTVIARKESDQLLLDYCALKKAYAELQSKVQDGATGNNGGVQPDASSESSSASDGQSVSAVAYNDLVYDVRVLSFAAMVPLIILLLAIVVAFKPFLSSVTATYSPPNA